MAWMGRPSLSAMQLAAKGLNETPKGPFWPMRPCELDCGGPTTLQSPSEEEVGCYSNQKQGFEPRSLASFAMSERDQVSSWAAASSRASGLS